MREDMDETHELLERGFTVLPPKKSGDPYSFQIGPSDADCILIWKTIAGWVSARRKNLVFGDSKCHGELERATYEAKVAANIYYGM